MCSEALQGVGVIFKCVNYVTNPYLDITLSK